MFRLLLSDAQLIHSLSLENTQTLKQTDVKHTKAMVTFAVLGMACLSKESTRAVTV